MISVMVTTFGLMTRAAKRQQEKDRGKAQDGVDEAHQRRYRSIPP